MQASPTIHMQLACMCLALMISSTLCLVPSSGTFTLDTIPNRGFKGRNGTAAYLKAVAKYAHLADKDGAIKAANLSEPCLYFPILFNVQHKATDQSQLVGWWVSTRRTTESGCAPSRLALLLRLSIWTLTLVLQTCEYTHITCEHATVLSQF
jgi:hypothetical protein